MIVSTKYFGDLECAEDGLIDFPQGIPGFEHLCRFVCLEQPLARPIVYLQSATDPDLCFLTVPVRSIDSAYAVSLTDDEAACLKLRRDETAIGTDIACMAILSTTPSQDPTVNLFAPVVINIRNRIGLQVIQSDSQYSFCHSVIPQTGSKGTEC
jgi:flagellar assembly factor FliW